VRNDTTLIQRFWEKVDKEEGEGCWVWEGSRSGSGGYGQVRNEFGEPEFAHRVAWRMANGPIPEGLHVCHKCDYPPCIRPSHLFLGTALDNSHDSIRKGRQRVKRRTVQRVLAESANSEVRTVVFSMRLTPSEWTALSRLSAAQGRPISDLVRLSIVNFLGDKPKAA
jgi:hypothetical protein